MRSAIIGAFFADKPQAWREFVRASSQLTHRSWQAETAALAVAEIVSLILTRQQPPPNSDVLSTLQRLSPEEEWQKLIAEIGEALGANESVAEFASRLSLENGVTGYALHVVAVAAYVWMIHRADFRSAMTEALNCGGDTDTVGAILGALCGASGGVECIPKEWLDGLWEWPRSAEFMRNLANRLAKQKESTEPLGAVGYFWPGVIPRNILFLAVVLLHGFRRLLPPY
jgi:ADP-ribosylglycohydrolase